MFSVWSTIWPVFASCTGTVMLGTNNPTAKMPRTDRAPYPAAIQRAIEIQSVPTADGNGRGGGHRSFSAAIGSRLSPVRGRCHARDRFAAPRQRIRTDHPTGAPSTGGGSGGAMTSLGGGAAATSSARRPSGRMSGVPQRLHDITVPNSDHFQHVGQQTFMTTAHSQQRKAPSQASCVDGAGTVTGSAQTSCNPGFDRCVSRIDDTNGPDDASSRRRRRVRPAARGVLICAHNAFAEPEPIGVGSDHATTQPAHIAVAVAVGVAGARVSPCRLRAELGHLRLSRDGVGSRQCPVRERHMPRTRSHAGRRSDVVCGAGTADPVFTGELAGPGSEPGALRRPARRMGV
jgi:hypothetical protein